MATIRIPPVLRPMTGDLAEVQAVGADLRGALDALCATYPDLRSRMLDEDGELRRFVNVFVDEEDVRTVDGLATRLRPDSSVIILPAMAGGSRSAPSPWPGPAR